MTNYDDVPGKAGAILRTASRCGLAVQSHAGSDILGWTIGTDPLDSLYVYWLPAKVRSGRTTIRRFGAHKLSGSGRKISLSEAQAWVRARRTRETAEG